MVKNSKGTISGNSRKLRGKTGLTVSKRMNTFSVGDGVVIDQKAVHKGQPHMRYRGRVGKILRRQGTSYVVEIRDGGMRKELIASPIHLRSV